jgi:lipoprotein-releasing system ATP-binding protein
MPDSPYLILVEKICKSFQQPDKSKLTVLDELSFSLRKNEMSVVTGVSGSGKSTFLHLLGGLDQADSGRIIFNGRDIIKLRKKELAEYRNQKVGFVFQFHYLMPELTVLENVAFPGLMKEFNKAEVFKRADELLQDVGLANKLSNMPFQLSGGERQRVAIARSLINSPDILLADEPTGNIDYKTGEKVFQLFRELIKERALTCVVVTHNEKFARDSGNAYKLSEGKLEQN